MSKSRYPLLNDRDWLFKKHIEEKLNLSQIGEIVGCDHHTVSAALKRWGIPQQKYAHRKPKKKWFHSEETKRKWSEQRKGAGNPMFGKHRSEEVKHKISEGNKGNPGLVGEKNPMFDKKGYWYKKHHTEETKKKIGEKQTGKKASEETKKKISNAGSGKKRSEATKKKLSESKKGSKNPRYHKQFTDEEKKELIGRFKYTFPTKLELVFDGIAKKNNVPSEYTGDGTFWVGNINPDFIIRSKRTVIEIFGYHHNELRRFAKVRYNQTYEGRKKIFKKHKWKLIVFWQDDLDREDAEARVLSVLKKENCLIP